MRAGFDKRWLLPFGILAISALVALGIFGLGLPTVDRSSTEVVREASDQTTETNDEAAVTDCGDVLETNHLCSQEHHQEAVSEPTRTEEVATADCSGASATDYICYQQRYRDLVRDYGVETAFAELKNELPTNEFARSNCHLLTHFIGRAAADLSSDVGTVYSHGDNFCGSGYYHGAMEAIVTKIGPDKVLEEANTLCDNLDGYEKYSFYHYNCAHGLGHGFMDIKDDELFSSLGTCDALTDSWERNRCYGGVFMENVVAKDDPGHSSKYLKADKPLYPCDVLGNRYKNECYQRQTSYALQTQGNDFAKVFDLCAKAENDFRPACYQGLGWDASVQSLKQDTSNATISESTRVLCTLGEDYEARSNCVIGAIEYFIRDRYDDTLARAFCDTLSAGLHLMCLQEAEEYSTNLQSPLERVGTSS